MSSSNRSSRQRPRIRLAPIIFLFLVCILVVVGGLVATMKWGSTNTSNSVSRKGGGLQGGGRDFVQAATELADGVYILGKTAPSAVYAMKTSTGILLVDSGLEADGRSVLQQLRELNLNVNDIRAILLTHAHGDHSLGARHLSSLSSARVYAGAADAEVLRAGGPREAFFSTLPMQGYEVHPTRVDVALKGGEELTFGDTRVRVIATPGHTQGGLCYLAERDNLRVLFAGDTISSLVGDLGIYAAYLPPRYRADASDYLASLRRLRELPVPDLVLPGHPFNPNVPSNPHLGETEWHQLLDRGIRELERLVARYESDGEDFLDGNPKELLPGLHYFGEHAEHSLYAIHTPEHVLWFDAPGGEDLVPFAESHLAKLSAPGSAPTAVLLTSADEDTIAGLDAFVERYGCAVVAAEEAHARIRDYCPHVMNLMTPAELEAAHWIPVDVIPLAGPGIGALVYSLEWEGKRVLICGKLPFPLTDKNINLLTDVLNSSFTNRTRYQQSLQTLGELRPELWLTSLPQFGQNANIYGLHWSDLIKRNLNVVSGTAQ